jgi:hypothetical protein|mmetsp:Transcript_23688/g.31398  ORF Transcript_23688/g.31398 Transcript_23688/m.31398 type:complete len:112 (-) Transcript_23688:2727-3062(-)
MGYDESFDNNAADEQSIEASFDDTYQGQNTVEVHEGIEMEDYHTMDENTCSEEETYEVGEAEDVMVYDSKPGDINCWCVPTRVRGCGNFFARTVAWTKLNKCELLGSTTGM